MGVEVSVVRMVYGGGGQCGEDGVWWVVVSVVRMVYDGWWSVW